MTPDTTALKELLEKVEAGGEFDWRPGYYAQEIRGSRNLKRALDAYEGSMDAALSLMEAVLPGWKWLCRSDDAGGFANVYSSDFLGEADWVAADGQTVLFKGRTIRGQSHPVRSTLPARALLIAILKTLIAEGGDHE